MKKTRPTAAGTSQAGLAARCRVPIAGPQKRGTGDRRQRCGTDPTGHQPDPRHHQGRGQEEEIGSFKTRSRLDPAVARNTTG